MDGAQDKYLHTLEQQFPHVAPRIVELRESPTIDQYFIDLMLHIRAAPRKGFPPKAAKEILNLILINNEQAKTKEGALINR